MGSGGLGSTLPRQHTEVQAAACYAFLGRAGGCSGQEPGPSPGPARTSLVLIVLFPRTLLQQDAELPGEVFHLNFFFFFKNFWTPVSSGIYILGQAVHFPVWQCTGATGTSLCLEFGFKHTSSLPRHSFTCVYT